MRKTYAIVAWTVVVALSCGACSESSLDASGGTSVTSGPATENPPTTSPEISSTTTSTTTPDLSLREAYELAGLAVLSVDDLGPGWVECCPPQVFPPDGHWCGADGGLPDRLAAHQREYSLNPREDGTSDGVVFGVAIVAASEEAAAEFESVHTDGYRECMIEDATADTEMRQGPISSGPFETSFAQEVLPVDHPAIIDRMVTTFPTSAGGRGWVRTDTVRMRVGAVLHRIQFRSYADELPIAEMAAVAERVADHS